MGTKRHKPEEIVSKLRQVDVLVGQGVNQHSRLTLPKYSAVHCFCSIFQFINGIIIGADRDSFPKAKNSARSMHYVKVDRVNVRR